MSVSDKKFYQPIDLNGNELKSASKVELTQDAQTASEAVRKSQAENIAETEVDGRLLSDASQASSNTMFTSQYTKSALDTKQPTMEIHPDSTEFLSIVDGYKIKVEQLLVADYYIDNAASDLNSFIASVTYNGDGTITTSDSVVLDKGTIIILNLAAIPQEKSFIYAGTNNGDETDYGKLGTELNASVIRAFFSAANFLRYDSGTGIYSVAFGTGANELGGHAVPVDPTVFGAVLSSASDVQDALKKLETFINQVDTNGANGTATVDLRIDNLIGVSGSNLGTFAEGIFSQNSDVKSVLQESETAHKNATTDRALIRSQFAAADTSLQSNLDAEAVARSNADISLQQSIATETSARQAEDATLTTRIALEETTRAAADHLLDNRVSTLEAPDFVYGSVANSLKQAKEYTDAEVLTEKTRAEAAEAALDQKIDNLAAGDIKFIGLVLSDGSLQLPANVIAAGDTRNGQHIKDVAMVPGETFVVNEAMTLSFNDSSSLVLQAQDKMLCVDSVSAGAASDSSFNVVQNTDSALTDANLDGQRIEKTAQGKLDIVDDSIGRDQLDAAIEADIDDKRSASQANAITSDGDTHFVSSSALGAQQNRYSKRTQVGSDPLSGTFRTELLEGIINTDGSGNPLALSAAHAITAATHYQGSCSDLTVLMGGGNFEANAKAGTAIQATGLYASAPKTQNGINVGLTAYANGAATSNVAVVGVAGTAGIGRDRGGLFAVADVDLEAYSAARQATPFPFNDIALTADARFGPAGCLAFYGYGDVRMNGGKVEVEQAPSTDESVMRLADVKGKEKCFQMDLVNGSEKLVACSLDLNKAIIQVVKDNQTVEVHVQRDVANSQLKVLAVGGDLTAVRVLVKELECDVTTV